MRQSLPLPSIGRLVSSPKLLKLQFCIGGLSVIRWNKTTTCSHPATTCPWYLRLLYHMLRQQPSPAYFPSHPVVSRPVLCYNRPNVTPHPLQMDAAFKIENILGLWQLHYRGVIQCKKTTTCETLSTVAKQIRMDTHGHAILALPFAHFSQAASIHPGATHLSLPCLTR